MRAVTIDSDLATLFTFTPRKPPITPIQEVLRLRFVDKPTPPRPPRPPRQRPLPRPLPRLRGAPGRSDGPRRPRPPPRRRRGAPIARRYHRRARRRSRDACRSRRGHVGESRGGCRQKHHAGVAGSEEPEPGIPLLGVQLFGGGGDVSEVCRPAECHRRICPHAASTHRRDCGHDHNGRSGAGAVHAHISRRLAARSPG